MRPMSAQEKFDLQPNGMFSPKVLPVIPIVLEADLGELTRIKRQVGRNARALAAENVLGVVSAGIAIDVFAPETSHPAQLKPPQHLRVKPQSRKVSAGRPNVGSAPASKR